MNNKFKFISIAALTVALIGGLLRYCGRRAPASPQTSSSLPVLPKNVKEEVLFDSTKHVIEIRTSKEDKKEYARKGTFEVKTDGTVKTQVQTIGTEMSPFLGAGYGNNSAQILLGINVFYVQRLDVFGALSFSQKDERAMPLIGVGYTFWRNTSINLGADPVTYLLQQKPVLVGFVSVKF